VTTQVPPSKEERAGLRRVAAVADLKGVTLMRVNAERVGTAPKVPQLHVTYTIQEKHKLHEASLDVAVKVICETDPHSYRIEAELALIYSLTSPVSEADASAFARLNAPFNAWPYMREFVQSMATRMTFAPPTVPLFRL
jgi:preprotein translocase subunit SecB